MSDLIREAPLGQLLRWATNNRLFPYPEELPGFELPEAYNTLLDSEKGPSARSLRTRSLDHPISRQSAKQAHTPTSKEEGSGRDDPEAAVDSDPYSEISSFNAHSVGKQQDSLHKNVSMLISKMPLSVPSAGRSSLPKQQTELFSSTGILPTTPPILKIGHSARRPGLVSSSVSTHL